jgi:hypothetical protein
MRIPTPQLLRVPKPELRKSVGKPGFVSVRKHPLVTMSFEQFLHLLLVYCTFTGPDVTKCTFKSQCTPVADHRTHPSLS